MKKHGLWIGIIFICIAGCLFFLVGTLVDGYWWMGGIPFAIFGTAFVLLSDKLNLGKEKRAREKEARDTSIATMKESLNERLAREKAERDETLSKIGK